MGLCGWAVRSYVAGYYAGSVSHSPCIPPLEGFMYSFVFHFIIYDGLVCYLFVFCCLFIHHTARFWSPACWSLHTGTQKNDRNEHEHALPDLAFPSRKTKPFEDNGEGKVAHHFYYPRTSEAVGISPKLAANCWESL